MSRVLKIPVKLDQKAKQFRHHEKVGMRDESFQKFDGQLSPFLVDEYNLWKLAEKISDSQYQMARQFPPLIPIYNHDDADGSCHICKGGPMHEGWNGFILLDCNATDTRSYR